MLMIKKYCIYLLVLSILFLQCRERKNTPPIEQPVTRSVKPVVVPVPMDIFYNDFCKVYKVNRDSSEKFMQYLINVTDSLGRIEKQVNYPVACLAAYRSFADSFGLTGKTELLHKHFIFPILNCGTDSVERDANCYAGTCHFNSSRYISAYDYFMRCINYSSKLGYLQSDYYNKERIFNNLGVCYTMFGDYQSALNHYDTAYQFNMLRGDYNKAAKNCNNISAALFDLQLYDSAAHVLQRISCYKSIDASRMALLQGELCRHYTMAGDMDAAKKALIEAEKIRDYFLVKRNQIKGKTKEDSIAIKDIQWDYDKAAGAVQQAASLFYFKNEDYIKAIAALKESDTSRSISRTRDMGKILKMLGDCYLKMQYNDTAMQYYQKSLYTVAPVDSIHIFSLPEKSSIYAENTIMEALDAKADLMAKLYTENNDLRYIKTAFRAYKLCFEVERKLMQTFRYDESRLLMLTDSRRRSEKAISLCYKLLQVTGDKLWAEEAFQLAEENKAFVLMESIKRNKALNIVLQSDTAYQEVSLLQRQLAYAENNILERSLSGADTTLPKLQKEKADIENKLLALQNSLLINHPWYQKEMEKKDSFSLAMVRESLPDNSTGVVEYFSGDSVTYVFTFSKTGPVQLVKTAPGLAPAVSSFLHFFTSRDAIINNRAAYRDSATALFNTLGIDSISRTCGQLLIIPDGPISFLPFEALVTTPGGDQLSNLAYLVKRCNISYGYSIATLLKQQTSNADPVGQTVGFAPVFNNDYRGLPCLKNTPRELSIIKDIFPNGSFFRENEATLGNFRKNAESAGTLHIATHAVGDTSHTIPPRIEFYDSTLWVSELYALQLRANLVVLSACETGIGRIDKSEGPMSLARGFYYAGAKNIVTSLWSVDDKSTAALFTAFYKNLSGNNYGNALHKAKLQYINDAESDAQASPYYWAGFIHIGYEKQVVHSNRWIWITGLASALAILVALLYSRKKGNKTRA